MREAQFAMVSLADNEWGSPLMEQVAKETLDANPELDYVLVQEHAGWFLSWNRDEVIVQTANDAAVLSPAAREWWRQFAGSTCVASIRRQDTAGVA